MFDAGLMRIGINNEPQKSMSPELYLTYLITITVLLAVPGPMTLMALSTSVRYGHAKAFFVILASNVAGLVFMALSALGVGALLQQQPMLFDGLRYAGAAYLIWLGISAWRAPVGSYDTNTGSQLDFSGSKLFFKTLMLGLSNPKGLIFFAALFPQFIDTQAPLAPQLSILCVSFTLMDFLILNLVAFSGCRLATLLSRANIQRRFNQACALVFIGVGGSIALV